MEKSYIEKIIPFITSMRKGVSEDTPSSFDVDLLYDGQEIDNDTLFKVNEDEATMLDVLVNKLDYDYMGDNLYMTYLWTFDTYPGLYALKGFVDGKYVYALVSDSEADKGGLLYASDDIPFDEHLILPKGYHNLEDGCYKFNNGDRIITLGEQADKWNGIIVGTPKD